MAVGGGLCLVIWLIGRLQWAGRHRVMRELADSLALDFSSRGLRFSRRIPQFAASFMVPARVAFDVVHGRRSIAGMSCEVVLGDCSPHGERAMKPLRRLVGTGCPGFVAVQLPRPGKGRGPTLSTLTLSSGAVVATIGRAGRYLTKSDEFNRRFTIMTDDRRFASDLFEPILMRRLMSDPPPVSVSIMGRWVVLASLKDPWTPARFRETLAWVERFIAGWPRHILEVLKADEAEARSDAAAVAAKESNVENKSRRAQQIAREASR